MIRKAMIGCLLGASALAAPVFAQGNPPPGSEPRPRHDARRDAAPVQQHGEMKFITVNDRSLWRASKLDGVDVYNERNEKIGDISEVLLDRNGRVEAVVIGVGGFLGIGERNVAVPFDALRWQMREDNTVATRTNSPMTGANRAPPTTDNVGDVAERSGRANPQVRENLGRNTVGEAPDRQRGDLTTGSTQPRDNTAVLETGQHGAAGRESNVGRNTAGEAPDRQRGDVTTGATQPRDNAALLDTGQRGTAGREPAGQRDAAAPRGERAGGRALADAPERAILAGATKEMLKSAPEFKYADR